MMGQRSRSKVKVEFKVKVKGQGQGRRQRGKIGPKKAVLKPSQNIGPPKRRFLDTADLSKGSLSVGQVSRSKIKVEFEVEVKGQGQARRQRGEIGPINCNFNALRAETSIFMQR